ncbi:MAG: hypothetical protein ACSLE6_05360 [Mycobacterium sp.]
MLLPVTLLLRRAYVAEVIWARLGIPGSTVRGWLRVITGRAERVWHWFIAVAVTAGVDV